MVDAGEARVQAAGGATGVAQQLLLEAVRRDAQLGPEDEVHAQAGVGRELLGHGIALVIDAFGPQLTASAATGGSLSIFGGGSGAARTATNTVSLSAPIGIAAVAIGFGLALLGGLIAGAAGALRAARLRPADALRQME